MSAPNRGESVSLSEPAETQMVYIGRFPGHKRFLIHMPIGRSLRMYCTAAGRPVAAINISEPTRRWTLEDLVAR